jgi:hypothetical protein
LDFSCFARFFRMVEDENFIFNRKQSAIMRAAVGWIAKRRRMPVRNVYNLE